MQNTGGNAGITGLASFPRVGSSGAKFLFRCFLAKHSLSIGEDGRAGRGDGDYPESGYLTSTGLMILQGELTAEAYHRPNAFIGQQGTVTVQFYEGPKTETVSVRVTGCAVERNEKSEGNYKITLTCRILSEPTLAGWPGTQATGDVATMATKSLWALMAKRSDPSALATAGQQGWDVVGIADNDAAEVTAIGAVISAYVASISGLKVKYADFRRLSSRRVQITVTESLTSTAEDYTLPRSYVRIDPKNLTSEAVQVGLNSTPATPSGAPFVTASVSTQLLNSGTTATTVTFALRNSQQAVEEDGSSVTDDPSDLEDQTVVTVVTTSGTPPSPSAPAGLVTRYVGTKQLNPGEWQHTFTYAERTTEQDVTFEGTVTFTDPAANLSRATIVVVGASGTADPAPASPLAEAKYTGGTVRQLTGGKWRWQYDYGTRTSQDEIEQEGTFTAADPAAITDTAEITLETASSTPPSIPTAPASQKHRGTRTRQRTDGLWIHTFYYGTRTSQDEIEQEGTSTTADANGLDADGRITQVTASSTAPADPGAPAGQKLRTVTTRQRTDGLWVHTFTYGLTDTLDDIQMPGTRADADAQDLEDGGVATVVSDTSTIPATPTAPGTSTLVLVSSTQRNDGKWVHQFRYGPVNTQQAKEYAGTTSEIDPAAIRDGGSALVVNASSTAPAAPAAPGASKLIATESTRLTSGGKWQHVFRYGTRTSQDEIEQEGTETTADANVLDARARITVVTASDIPPVTPTAPTSQKLRTTTTRQRTDGLWVHTFAYGLTDTLDDVQMPGTVARADAQDLEDSGEATVVNASSTPPSTPSAPGTSVLVYVDSTQLNDTEWKHRFTFGPANTKQAKEFAGTVTRIDAQALDDGGTALVVNGSSTPPATPSAPGTSKLVRRESKQLTAGGKWQHVFTYGPRDSADDVNFAAAIDRIDPNAITSTSDTSAINSTAAAGLAKIIEIRGKRLTDGSVQYTTVSGLRDSKDEINFKATYTDADVLHLASRADVSEIVATGGNGTATAAPLTELRLSGTTRVKVTDNLEQLVHQWRMLDSKQVHYVPEKTAVVDSVNAIDGTYYDAAVMDTTAVPGTIPTPDADYVFVDYRTKLLTEDTVHGTATAHSMTLVVYQFGKADTLDRLLRPFLTTDTDPQALRSVDFAAEMYDDGGSAPADPGAPSGLKLFNTRDVSVAHNRLKKVRVWEYRKVDSKDEITMPGTTSKHSTEDRTFVRRDTELVACSAGATPETLASARFTTELAVTGTAGALSLDSVVAMKVTDTLARIVIDRVSGGIRQVVKTYARKEWVYAVNSAGTLKVLTGKVKQRGSRYWVKVKAQQVWVTVYEIELHRRVMTTSGGAVDGKGAFLLTRNNATWLGLAAGYVTFLGREIDNNMDIGSTEHPYNVIDRFEYRSNGIHDELGVEAEWVDVGSDPGADSLVAASTFGYTSVALSSADYSGFLT